MNPKRLYLIGAIVGAVLPYLFFGGFFLDYGLDLPLFIQQLFETSPASGFTLDLLVSSFVFWVFLLSEANAGRIRAPWIYIVVNLLIGLSCALPLSLYFRNDAKQRA